MNDDAGTSPLTRWLSRAPALPFMLYASSAAFCTYFCMYGYRKAFTVGRFEGEEDALGLSFKAALVISQIIGYTISKFAGIRLLSELHPRRRAGMLIGCILLAEISLVAFGLFDGTSRLVAIFFNGLPLGIVWGLVYSFLEGRRTSEILGAVLCCSFILASGFAKSVGAEIMEWTWIPLWPDGVPEVWMPAVAGLLYLPVFLTSVWMLSRLPAPSDEDVSARVKRAPMNFRQRTEFLRKYFVGLVFLLSSYVLLTTYRDYRDNFAADIFAQLKDDIVRDLQVEIDELPLDDLARGELEAELVEAEAKYSDTKIFTKTEVPIALSVLCAMALLYVVKNNRLAFFLTHFMMIGGTILIGLSTILFDRGTIDGVWWMIMVGLGLYLAYVPYNCVLFDRMVAAMRTVATAVFTIYVADALGYIGSISSLLYKYYGESELNHIEFFRLLSYVTAVYCTLSCIASVIYFRGRRPEA